MFTFRSQKHCQSAPLHVSCWKRCPLIASWSSMCAYCKIEQQARPVMHKPHASAPAACQHVLLQFPHRGLQDLGIHGHLFVNGGNLSLLSGTGRSIHQVVSEDFTKRWRWTAVSLSCHSPVMPSSVPKLCIRAALQRLFVVHHLLWSQQISC